MLASLAAQDRYGQSNYRWYILVVSVLTNTISVAIPSMALSVLFAEISADLHLNLVQVGLIWGIGALPAIFTSLIAGMISDRVGPRLVLLAGCLLTGVTGALRGMSVDFATLLSAVLLFGLFSPMITTNTMKTCGMWFSRQQMGLASGFLSMGMAFGFLIGSLLSATLLSPALGGWRHVLFLYGGLSALLSLAWFFTRLPTSAERPVGEPASPKTLRQTLTHVARLRNLWLLGLAIFGFGGGVQGALGYLPLYLRKVGWPVAGADGALAAFQALSLIFVIPIALGSDKLGTRKKVLVAAAFVMMLGVASLSFAQGLGVWIAVCLAGMVRDGFMAVFMTAIIETDGVGSTYSGTAMGFVMIFSGVGNLVTPPLGNSLASISPGLPFVFWAAMTGLGLVGLLASRDHKPVLVPALEALEGG